MLLGPVHAGPLAGAPRRGGSGANPAPRPLGQRRRGLQRCNYKPNSELPPAAQQSVAPVAPAQAASRGSKADDASSGGTLPVETLRHLLTPRPSPFTKDNNRGGGFVGDGDRVRIHTAQYESDARTGLKSTRAVMDALDGEGGDGAPVPDWAVRSGPRETVYFDPQQVVAAIVTCDGVCPGTNDVVQNVVNTLVDYGVPEDQVLGIKYGLRGFYARDSKPVTLTRSAVDGIHLKGGTMLGTSRGAADIAQVVRRIDLWGVNQLYIIGGIGGIAAAQAIHEEATKQGVVCTVATVPKSIDNDILLIDSCFGFDTAVAEAHRALLAAKVEASSGCRGIGLVKLMGRKSGFIAMQAALASGVVDICLIPEMGPLNEARLMEHTNAILNRKGHCVVCVAEGVGQERGAGVDERGYAVLKDIGVHLRDAFKAHFGQGADVKYIDPSYLIRATPPSSSDRIYSKTLGQGAVHASFAAYTGFSITMLKTHFVLLPTRCLNKGVRSVNVKGRTWTRLKTSINQPDLS